MKVKLLLACVIALSTIATTLDTQSVLAQENTGARTPVDTLKDNKSKTIAKYAPDNSLYCSATLITPNIALTSRHCAGKNKIEGNIGSIYPGQSGISTPFGKMDISTYIPDTSQDIAILKGRESDKSKDYKHYIKDFNLEVKGRTFEELRSLMGKEVYSYGYPSDLYGSPQIKSEGKIIDFDPHTKVLTTSIPTVEGQSGSGVFLKENDGFLGVLYGKKSNSDGQVVPIDERLKKWFDNNTKND
ncbi:trypsin-like serine peptidase [Staphylococcus agnetis]|nr:trypsin-like serine protease [Staphylococcus agnetis]